MEASVCIAQKGTVEEIVNHTIRVRIQRESACGHCNARSMCNLSDISERIIEAYDNGLDLKIGDFVEITITRSMGHKAVLLGYLLPFLLVITILILLNALKLQEWLSGLISLGMLIPYYMFLYLLRDRLKKSFTFTLSKKE
jgi:sigma-E factor negative regulatory protein RseC